MTLIWTTCLDKSEQVWTSFLLKIRKEDIIYYFKNPHSLGSISSTVPLLVRTSFLVSDDSTDTEAPTTADEV